jgi:hypothetical protein
MPPELDATSTSSAAPDLGLSLRDGAPPAASPDPQSTPAPAAGAEGAAPSTDALPVTQAARPDFIPEKFWDAEKGAPKVNWQALEAREAAEAERAALIPETPDGYQPVLPEGFALPDGVELMIDVNDPAFKAAQAFAKERGLTQPEFSTLLTLEAQRVTAEKARLGSAIEAEKAKLGEQRGARIKAVDDFLLGRLPEKQAKALQNLMVTAEAVEAFETLMGAVKSDGVGGFGGGRDGGKDRISDEEWNRLPLHERINMGRRLAG